MRPGVAGIGTDLHRLWSVIGGGAGKSDTATIMLADTIVVWEFDKFWPSSNFPHSERSLCLIIFHSNICVSHMLKCIFLKFTAWAWATAEHYRSSKLNVLGVWQFRHTGVTSNLAVRWQRMTANKALGGARESRICHGFERTIRIS